MFGSDKGDFPIDFDDVWRWLDYSRKNNALRALIDELDVNADYIQGVLLNKEGKATGGRPSDKYYLSVDGFKVFCMAAGTQRGKEVRRYFVEVEKAYKELAANRAMEDVFAPAPMPDVSAAMMADLMAQMMATIAQSNDRPLMGRSLDTAEKRLRSVRKEYEDAIKTMRMAGEHVPGAERSLHL
jgi:phage anti-repressor protein